MPRLICVRASKSSLPDLYWAHAEKKKVSRLDLYMSMKFKEQGNELWKQQDNISLLWFHHFQHFLIAMDVKGCKL